MSEPGPRGAARISVILAEDAVLFRDGIARILRAEGFDVIAEVGDRDGLLDAVERDPPDIVVTDIRMPPTGTTEGLDAAAEILQRWPGTSVLVLSQYVESRHAMRLLEQHRGGIGYLLKDRVVDGADFSDAVKRVARGGSAIDPEVVARLLGRVRAEHELAALTPREREILAAMAEGLSNHGISELLVLSPKTVESHVGAIFSKLGLEPATDDHRRVLAVLAYLRAT